MTVIICSAVPDGQRVTSPRRKHKICSMYKWTSTIQQPKTQRYLDKKKKPHKSYILSQSPVLCVSETWRPHHFAAFFLFKWAQLLPEAWGPEQNLAWTRMGESLVSGLCVTNVRSCRRPRGNATASHDSSWPSSNHPTLHPMSAPIASVKPPPTHTTNQHSWWHHSAVKFPRIQYVHVAEP